MITPKIDTGAEQRIVNDFGRVMKLKLGKDAPYNREIVDQIIRRPRTGRATLRCSGSSPASAGRRRPAIEFANRASRHFLGIRLRCASATTIPSDKWKEHDFYRNGPPSSGRTKVKGGADVELSESTEGDAPKMYGGNFQPQFIYGQKPGKTDQWMDCAGGLHDRAGKSQLALATVNRVWSWLFGRGLVHPVDDFNMNEQGPRGGMIGVSYAKEFRGSKFSIKSLYRGI